MYIQKASEARRSYASVLNVATTFDGNREGNLLNMDVSNMVEFLEEFYEKIPVKPEEVDFVETYGCALKETDRKELEALEQDIAKHQLHCSLSQKVIIAMETDTIPANLQFENPNPEIAALHNGNMEVVTTNRKWNPRYAAVNALGVDSYYGHALFKANPKSKVPTEVKLPTLVIASTRTQEGIDKILETIKSKPKDPEYYQLIQDVFAKPILGHLYRGYAVLGSGEPKQETVYHMGNKRQIWFVYSGMGSQWCGMVSDLMKLEVFAKSINESHKILAEKGVDLINIITTNDKTIFDNILNSFVGIAAIQIALTDVLKAVGIVPDGIIGHSVGELGCAYGDGCMTAKQMILSAYSRGRASLEATLIKGMMAAIGLGYHQIKDRIPPTIEVACHNGPDSCTISGPTEDMEKFVKQLQDEGIFARLVNVANIAYHSRYIKPAAPLLLKYLNDVLPEPVARSPKWISTSNVEGNWSTHLAKHSSAEYHTNNLLSSVLFEEGTKHIPKDSILIEIAPHGLLQAILKRSIKTGTNIPLTQRGSKSGLAFLLQSLGKLYLAGLDLTLSNLYPKFEYPVSRGTAHLGDLVHWNHSEVWRSGLEDKLHPLFGVRDITVTLNSDEFRDCVNHQLNDNIVMPTSFYLVSILKDGNIILFTKSCPILPLLIRIYYSIICTLKKVLTIPKIGSIPLHAMVQKGSGEFEILSDKDIIMTGRMTFPQADDKFLLDPIKSELIEENVKLSGSDIYNELQHRGHKYFGQFKAIKGLTITEEAKTEFLCGSTSVIQWNNKWTMLLEAMIQQQILHSGEKTQEIHVPKTIQKIAISQTLLPDEKTDLQVNYDYSTKTLYAEGIQLIRMKTVPLETEQKSAYLDSVEYASLTNNIFNKIETGINLALQLMLANFDDQDVTTLVITEFESEKPLSENIKNVLNECTKLNANVSIVNDIKQIVIQQSYPLLLVVNDVANEEILKLVSSSHAFLLSRTDKTILSQTGVIQVAQFTVDDVSYSLLKKVNNSPVSVVTVKGDVLSIKDLKRSSVSWVNELYTALKKTKSNQNNVFLFSSIIPIEGFYNFVQELRSLPDTQSLRVFFNMDKKSGDFIPLFKQDLTLTILKDGIYKSYLPVSIKFKENVDNNQFTSNIIKNKIVHYLGVNLSDETLNPAIPKKNKVGNIDYSGVTTSGERIMGLAKLDKENNKLVADPNFTWEVPERWSLEDAVTIPNAYVCAYYMLMIEAGLRPGDTVLVHAGCSPIGLAAISIAFSKGCKVFATISAEWQRAYLKKQFICMLDRDILSSDDSSFEPQLKQATGGRGAEVILNCLSGSLLQNSLECIANYGRFIQYGKYDLEEGNSIGMYCFLRNTSFYTVDLENVFIQSDEIKSEIKKFMTEGIDNQAVRPLLRKIVNHQNIDVILSAENWTDIIEWLVLRGARKIVVSSEFKPQQDHINRRLSLLQSYYGADIISAPNKAYTKEGAAELLSEVYFLGPIHGVFLLPNKATMSKTSDVKHVQYIDNALRTTAPKALFVNFISSAAGICQIRSDAGFSTYNIQWWKELDIKDAISGLDDILNCKLKNILIKNDKVSDTKQESTQGLFKKLTQMLPTPADIIRNQKYAPKEPELEQIVTEGPREIRELAPILIVPSVTGQKELEELAMGLLYPTFYTVLPSTAWSISDMAIVYVEKMRAIWPKGPYNIIAISWGGALAIEIARILHKLNTSIHLFLIDSAPNTLQAAIKHLGEDKRDMEINLLSRVLKINDAKVIKDLQDAPDWQSRIRISLENYDGEEKHKKLLEEGLVNLKGRLEDVSAFQPITELVSGTVHLIRPSDSSKYDNCGLTARAKFNVRYQQEGETLKENLEVSDKLIKTCEYGQLTDELMRDRIAVGQGPQTLRVATVG
ncbi:hypothetical protein NQ314_002933 [Rhamnusium bicolor]|uniref:Uncharacterized protein n=1 Tax=Rhamnusium bicolor TaxID=1586634 RepID=A0AAV8ZPK6_9CUCU|nr:hypothetical protein NQ314_002933 [Rhamnusium bicolor]